jgi:hypothetical protein
VTTADVLRDTAVTVEVERLTDELLTASQRYRRAKARFARITDRYGTGVEAELRARTDYARGRAGADCGWYGDQMVRLGTALLALSTVARGGAS